MEFRAGDGARKVLMTLIALLTVLAAGLIGLLAGLFSPWILLGLIPVSVSGLFVFLWYPPRFAASLSGTFDGTAVRASMGVIWQKEIFVPMNALRTFECWKLPFHRFWKCRTIILRFAGGATMLPLLREEDAQLLVERLEETENP